MDAEVTIEGRSTLESPAADSAARNAKPKEHLAWLDSLRAIAVLWVVLHHAYTGLSRGWTGPLGRLIGSILANGQLAVASFIAISGYSLTLPVLKNGLRTRGGVKEFYLSRAIRIIPPYFCALIIAIALIAIDVAFGFTHLTSSDSRNLLLAIPLHFLILQDVFAKALAELPRWSNGVFWSIGVELKIYLLFPLFLFIARKRGFATTFAVALAISALLFVLPRQNFSHKASYVLIFLLGVYTCYASRTKTPKKGFLIFLVSAGIVAGLVSTEPAKYIGLYMSVRDIGIGASTCGLMYALGAEHRLRSCFEVKWLTYIGSFAYSIYLMHVQLIQLFSNTVTLFPKVNAAVTPFIATTTYVILALILSRAFYVLCEKPFFKKRHREAEKIISS